MKYLIKQNQIHQDSNKQWTKNGREEVVDLLELKKKQTIFDHSIQVYQINTKRFRRIILLFVRNTLILPVKEYKLF